MVGFLDADLQRRLGHWGLAEAQYAEVEKIPCLSRFTSLMRHVFTNKRLFTEELARRRAAGLPDDDDPPPAGPPPGPGA